MLPPAAPTTHQSTERIAVGRPITLSVRSTVRPPSTTETFEDVPPHSSTIAVGQLELVQRGGDARPPGPAPTGATARAGTPRGSSRRRRRAARAAARRCRPARAPPRTIARRALHQRQDRGVDRGADGAQLEPVGAGQLVARARRQAALARALGDEPLRLRRVDRERALRRRSRVQPAAARRSSAASTSALGEAAASRRGRRARCAARGRARAPRRRRRCACARAQVGLAADADDADPRDVALEQRVHRLRRREGDELDRARVGAELREQLGERLGDALGDAARRRGGWSARRRARAARTGAARPRPPS